MPLEPPGRTDDGTLERTVERQVLQRTWGRIHQLQVERLGDRLIVHGCTGSYYAKQLALEGALEAIGSTDAASVELDIQVGRRTLPTGRSQSPAFGVTPGY